MSELNVDDVLLLIHGEITTAVNSAITYGDNPNIQLQNIRVRMGQETQDGDSTSDTVSLNTERFPPAKDGWLIDVSYSPTNTPPQGRKLSEGSILASAISPYFARLSPKILSGVGQHYSRLLQDLGIHTISELASYWPNPSILQESELTPSQIRGFQSTANLVLSVSASPIPLNLMDIEFGQLIDSVWFNKEPEQLSSLPAESKTQFSHWLQQLEACLDNDFFNT